MHFQLMKANCLLLGAALKWCIFCHLPIRAPCILRSPGSDCTPHVICTFIHSFWMTRITPHPLVKGSGSFFCLHWNWIAWVFTPMRSSSGKRTAFHSVIAVQKSLHFLHCVSVNQGWMTAGSNVQHHCRCKVKFAYLVGLTEFLTSSTCFVFWLIKADLALKCNVLIFVFPHPLFPEHCISPFSSVMQHFERREWGE